MVLTLKPAEILYWLLLVSAVALAIVFLAFGGKSAESAETMAVSGCTLVIDAGHGGADGGAVSLTGEYESNINLEIALKMQALSELTATPCVMTRESAEIDYPSEATTLRKKKVFDQQSRVALIESIPNAVLVSIHQNKYPTSQPRGPHSFYGGEEGSSELASLVQEKMNAMLYPENRRVAAPVPSDIYLFKNISCPSVLVECGFVSNPEEARLLEDETHQLKIAVALMSAYLSFSSAQQ